MKSVSLYWLPEPWRLTASLSAGEFIIITHDDIFVTRFWLWNFRSPLEFMLKEKWRLSENKQNDSVSEWVCGYVCVCVCVSVLDHLPLVMGCQVKVITVVMFITQPASVLSRAATRIVRRHLTSWPRSKDVTDLFCPCCLSPLPADLSGARERTNVTRALPKIWRKDRSAGWLTHEKAKPDMVHYCQVKRTVSRYFARFYVYIGSHDINCRDLPLRSVIWDFSFVAD